MDKPTEGQLLAAAVMELISTGHSIVFAPFATGGGYWCFSYKEHGMPAPGDGRGATKMEALENLFIDRAYMRL